MYLTSSAVRAVGGRWPLAWRAARVLTAMLAASRRIRFSPPLQGRCPASRLAMAACQSIWASLVTPSVSGVPVRMKRAKSSRCSHPVLMRKFAGCFEVVEPGGAGAKRAGHAGVGLRVAGHGRLQVLDGAAGRGGERERAGGPGSEGRGGQPADAGCLPDITAE